jgi:type IX secretion system PorP/SprF family membrane protein
LWAQQSAQFSQYVFDELYINPAYAGYKEDFYAHTSYRMQWAGMEGAPRTFVLGVDQMLKPQINWGVQIYNDRIGLLNSTSLMASYAYRLRLNRSYYLAMGFALGGLHTSINAALLDGASESGATDPMVAASNFSHLAPDVALGAYLSCERWYIGISAQNLVAGNVGAPTDKSYKLPQIQPTFFLSAGFLWYVARDVKLKPTLLYKEDFAGQSSFDFNFTTLLFSDRLWLGLGYRTGAILWKGSNMSGASSFQGNTLVGMLELFVSRRLRVGYSYDHSLAAAGVANSGSHEVSLGFYVTKATRPAYSPRYF